MLAFTYLLIAGPLLLPVPSVERVMLTPPTVKTPVALAVNTAAVALLIVNVHVAVLPENGTAAPQVVDIDPGAGVTLVVMFAVVAGVAVPGVCVATIVKTCAVPTSFTPLGVIVMPPLTYFLTAGPLPPGPAFPDVERVTVTPPMVT